MEAMSERERFEATIGGLIDLRLAPNGTEDEPYVFDEANRRWRAFRWPEAEHAAAAIAFAEWARRNADMGSDELDRYEAAIRALHAKVGCPGEPEFPNEPKCFFCGWPEKEAEIHSRMKESTRMKPGRVFRGECSTCCERFEIWPKVNPEHGGIVGVVLTDGCAHLAAMDQKQIDKIYWDAFQEKDVPLQRCRGCGRITEATVAMCPVCGTWPDVHGDSDLIPGPAA